MTANDLVLLDGALQERQAARDTPLADDVAFELFACELLLRDYDLSSDEVEAGRVGGGNDGALDGVFVFLGDTLLTEDAEVLSDQSMPSAFPRDLTLTLWLIQAKRTSSFSETAIDLASSSLGRLLDLQKDEDSLRALYSSDVIQRVRMFARAWQKLSTRRPILRINFAYATRGSTVNIDDKVRQKATELKAQLADLVSGADVSVDFHGASELWTLHNKVPSYTLQLPFQENATSSGSHVAIVRLGDYFAFIAGEDRTLLRHVFDWNVRDYQGDIEVNREIRDSLTDDSSPEFWWLNNGVTIICSSATIVNKTYILNDVQIVNGLQTSHTVYEVLRARDQKKSSAVDGSLLVRILVTDDPAVRDKVIRATNRQTNVPVASLRATDAIQRDIESYFARHGWFYDRRKNYYRNIGKSPERIVSIPLLAQSVMAIGLSEPNNSRARPSSLLKRDEDYNRVFSSEVGLDIYLWIAKTQRRVDVFLTSEMAGATASERTDLRFYVSMLLVARTFGNRIYSPVQLGSMTASDQGFTDE
jgi:hypothetical protein